MPDARKGLPQLGKSRATPGVRRVNAEQEQKHAEQPHEDTQEDSPGDPPQDPPKDAQSTGLLEAEQHELKPLFEVDASIPLAILAICTSFETPRASELSWKTLTTIYSTDYNKISVCSLPMAFLNKTLLAASGRTSRSTAKFELVVLKSRFHIDGDFDPNVPPRKPENINEIFQPKNPFKNVLYEIIFLAMPQVLQHKNIIDLLGILWEADVGGKHQLPTLILELAPHGSLKQVLDAGVELSFREKLSLLVDVCSALQTIHHELIVSGQNVALMHSDLKPENILIFDSDSPVSRYSAKLGDLGLTYLYMPGKELPAKLLRGTDLWKAPKLKQGSGTVNPTKAEIYSFGLVCCYLFFGGQHFRDLVNVTNYMRENETSFEALATNSEDTLLSLLFDHLEASTYNADEKVVIKRLIQSALPSNPDNRCGDFNHVATLFKADAVASRRREPTEGYVDIMGAIAFQLIIKGAFPAVTLSISLPYHVRQMIIEYSKTVYDRLIKTAGNNEFQHLKGQMALLVGLLTLVPPLLTTDEEERVKWLGLASNWNMCNGPVYARFHPSSIADPEEAERILGVAVLTDSVFAHEDMARLHLERYNALLEQAQGCGIGSCSLQFLMPEESVKGTLKDILGDISSKSLIDAVDAAVDPVQRESLRTLRFALFQETLTHFAAHRNDVRLLSVLQRIGSLSASTNLKGESPAHFAARGGHLQALEKLADYAMLNSTPCVAGTTPLHYLCAFESEASCDRAARLLLGRGEVNLEQQALGFEEVNTSFHISHATSQGGSALHWAVAKNNEAAARILVRYGANPYSKNRIGRTPWDLAVAARLVNLLRIFEENHKCLDVNERIKLTEMGLATPLVCVRLSTGGEHMQRSLDTFSFLLGVGAITKESILTSLGAPASSDPQLLEHFISEHRDYFTTQLDSVYERLVVAAHNGEAPAVSSLLPLAQPVQGEPAPERVFFLLHSAIMSRAAYEASYNSLSKVLEHLASDQAFDINERYSLDTTDEQRASGERVAVGRGATLLHHAFSIGRLDLAQLLLDSGANPTMTDLQGVTPLGKLLFIESQLGNAALETLAGSSRTPIFSGFSQAYPEFLFENAITRPKEKGNVFHQIASAWEGGRIHGGLTHGRRTLGTLLGYFQNRDPGYLKVLLNQGIESSGWTPVHHAARSGYVVGVRLMMDFGADSGLKDGEGLAPKDRCEERSWDKELAIQTVSFESIGMPWLDADGLIAGKLRREYDQRTQETIQMLQRTSLENAEPHYIPVYSRLNL